MTHRPTGELDEHSLVNLDLLKGLLNEIHAEVYVEDIKLRLSADEETYDKNIDINDYEGFSEWEEIKDHDFIQRQVFQMVLIDPHTIIDAFGIKASAPKSNDRQNEDETLRLLAELDRQ